MTAVAASNAIANWPYARVRKAPCKPRANYLKPKEIRKDTQGVAACVLTCGSPSIIYSRRPKQI
jgi:hypothetical protein